MGLIKEISSFSLFFFFFFSENEAILDIIKILKFKAGLVSNMDVRVPTRWRLIAPLLRHPRWRVTEGLRGLLRLARNRVRNVRRVYTKNDRTQKMAAVGKRLTA